MIALCEAQTGQTAPFVCVRPATGRTDAGDRGNHFPLRRLCGYPLPQGALPLALALPAIPVSVLRTVRPFGREFGGDTIPCPHCNITIVSRAKGNSAVASSAYLSAEKLYSEYDRLTRDYSHKNGVIHAEVLLPSNAPPEFANREVLWNSVEKVEKQWNSQLARRIILACPKELTHEENIRLLKQYCQEQFVSKGMCCDFALHDEGNGNPHAHILLTMRALDEKGQWMPKSRKVYDLDSEGNRIKLPSGNWKSHKEDTVDWNEQKYAEIWRDEWGKLQNQYLQEAGREERVDMRSYERQGVDQIPTVHMGAALTNMERKGIQTDIGNLNREIVSFNRLLQSVNQLVANALDWIDRFRAVLAERKKKERSLADYLFDYVEQRNEERLERKFSKSTNLKMYAKDVNKVLEANRLLAKNGIFTISDLQERLNGIQSKVTEIGADIKKKEARAKTLTTILNQRSILSENAEVYKAYSKLHFKKQREKYYTEHKPEIDAYNKALRELQKHPKDADTSVSDLRKEQRKLEDSIQTAKESLEQRRKGLRKLKDYRYWIQQTMSREDYKRLSDPNWKPSIRDRLDNRHQTDMEQNRQHTEYEQTTKRSKQEL